MIRYPVEGHGLDPRAVLRYGAAGRIESDDLRAVADIETLNLNALNLVRSRNAVMDAVRQRLDAASGSIAKKGELRALLAKHSRRQGVVAPEHAEAVLFFVRRWLRSFGVES